MAIAILHTSKKCPSVGFDERSRRIENIHLNISIDLEATAVNIFGDRLGVILEEQGTQDERIQGVTRPSALSNTLDDQAHGSVEQAAFEDDVQDIHDQDDECSRGEFQGAQGVGVVVCSVHVGCRLQSVQDVEDVEGGDARELRDGVE